MSNSVVNANFTKVVERAGKVQNVVEANRILAAKVIATQVNLGIQNFTHTGINQFPITTGGLTGGDLWYDQTGFVHIIV